MPVWTLNALAIVLLLFTFTLSSADAITRTVVIACLSVAFGVSYFSVRARINLIGVAALVSTAYTYAIVLTIVFKHA
jgi:hypothetical protein